MKILFRAYFHKKNFRKKFAENLLGSGSGSGSGRFRKSDPDPVKNRPDPQHWLQSFNNAILVKLGVLGLLGERIPQDRSRHWQKLMPGCPVTTVNW
jgi:hypothetical protein